MGCARTGLRLSSTTSVSREVAGIANYLYVDNSNVWIEGMHVSAVHRGIAPNIWTAQNERITDHAWKIDFGKLYEFAGGTASEVGRAVLFGSRPPRMTRSGGSLSRRGSKSSYTIATSAIEKKIDTNIATAITSDSYRLMDANQDEITLVAGDADYVPVVEDARERGFAFYVVFWNHASKNSSKPAPSSSP